MSEISRILSAIEHGDPSAAKQLLPLVYEELKKMVSVPMPRAIPLKGKIAQLNTGQACV
jgi:hypothetical protein